MNTSSYLGKNDIFDLGEQNSFAGEHITGNDYGFRVVNNSDADKVIAFSPAVLMGVPTEVFDNKIGGIDLFITASGAVLSATELSNIAALREAQQVEIDLGNDSAAAALANQINELLSNTVTIESLNQSNPLEALLAFAAVNPLRITKLALNSSEKSWFSETIRQRIWTPFKSRMGELDLNLRRYVNANQFQDDRTEIALLKENMVLTMAFDTVIYFNVKANSDIQVIMDIGAVNNGSAVLRRRARIAQENVVSTFGASPQQ